MSTVAIGRKIRTAHFFITQPQDPFLVMAAFRWCWAGGRHYDFLKTPNLVTQASGDAWRKARRLVGSGETQ
jgi:hypothetical protein